MRPCQYPIATLLPHRPPMVLLDKVTGYDDNSLIAEVTITQASLFLGPQGVPGHVGIEYMAQACGAYAGAQALDSGDSVKIGLLLGTRDYRVMVPYFRRGDRLLIAVAMVFRDEPVAAFACSITIGGKIAAEAQLKVYQAGDDWLRLGHGGK
ncbi:MAG: 3-hydroxylacyl-ACP dehydratase [Candidatus Binataceae bacterium]|nr:3-hydroxylacyl-ACP dehydratase [Candidatus Binataceae bacterium]